MLCDDYEANWNRQADEQDHILSQGDALTKNTTQKDHEKSYRHIPEYRVSQKKYTKICLWKNGRSLLQVPRINLDQETDPL